MQRINSTASINAGRWNETDCKILELLSGADRPLSGGTIAYLVHIRLDTALKRLKKLQKWRAVALVTRKETSFWKAVEEGA